MNACYLVPGYPRPPHSRELLSTKALGCMHLTKKHIDGTLPADRPAPDCEIEITPAMIEAGVCLLMESGAIEHPLSGRDERLERFSLKPGYSLRLQGSFCIPWV